MSKISPDTAAAIQRVIKIRDRAREVFGSATAAKDWLDKMSSTLGSSPKDLAIVSKEGMDQVLLHLTGIERNRHE